MTIIHLAELYSLESDICRKHLNWIFLYRYG